MLTEAPFQVLDAEQSLAELVERAYGVYSKVLRLLPRFLDEAGQEQSRYLRAVADAGATFSPDLAMAARFADGPLEADWLPSELPRLVRLLEDGFILLSTVKQPADLREIASTLPTQAELDATLDTAATAWINDHRAGFRRI